MTEPSLSTIQPMTVWQIVGRSADMALPLARGLFLLIALVISLEAVENIISGLLSQDLILGGLLWLISALVQIPLRFLLFYAPIVMAAGMWRGEVVGLRDAIESISVSTVVRIIGLVIAVGIFSMLWSILLIIPGIIYAFNRSLSMQFVILEDASVRESLRRSKSLMTRESFFSLSGAAMRLSGLYLILMVIGITATIPIILFSIVQSAASLSGFPWVHLVALLLLVVGGVTTILAGLISTTAIVGFYYDLRSRYEPQYSS